MISYPVFNEVVLFMLFMLFNGMSSCFYARALMSTAISA